MDIFCLEGKDDKGKVVYRVFTHSYGNCGQLSLNIANKKGITPANSRIMSIEDVRQITDMGGEYLYQTSEMATDPNNFGLSFYAVEINDGESAILWGPNQQFVNESINDIWPEIQKQKTI